MSTATPGMSALLEELLGLLDEEIALLTVRRSQLEALSTVLVEGDPDATERLLHEMEQTQTRQADTDRKLQALRAALANALGRDERELRLAGLVQELPEPIRSAVDYRRQQIVGLVEDLRRQHLGTTMQLVECVRINRMLLEGLFGAEQSLMMYDMHGTPARGPGGGLVDAEL